MITAIERYNRRYAPYLKNPGSQLEKSKRFNYHCQSTHCTNPDGRFIGSGFVDSSGFEKLEAGEYSNKRNGKTYHSKCFPSTESPDS